MIFCVQLLSLISLAFANILEENNNFKPKIAIIGGGIGGTATAYFLRELFEENVTLHLYEPNKIGGRLATATIEGRDYETGGAIIHEKNIYMKAFVRKFALKERKICSSTLGLFNGQNYSFIDSSWELVSIAKLFYRYGLDIFWLQRKIDSMLNSFSTIYQSQIRGESFDSVEELLYSMDPAFPSYLEVSLREQLKNSGYHDLIVDELVTAITLTNYGQLPDIHSFVGNVAISGAGSSLWAIEGGNKRVPEILLEDSEAIRFRSKVTSISSVDKNKLKVTSINLDDKENSNYIDVYDAVAIAAPLTRDASSLTFLNFTEEFTFPGHYQKIFSTLVQGELNSNTFEEGVKVDEILSFNRSLYFNSIGLLKPIDNKPEIDCKEDSLKVFKVFSPERLTSEQLNSLFKEYASVSVTEWLAYPHYDSKQSLGKFTLRPGLYYNNAIEFAASAMEMSAVGARNVALLIHKYFGGDIEEYLSRDEL